MIEPNNESFNNQLNTTLCTKQNPPFTKKKINNWTISNDKSVLEIVNEVDKTQNIELSEANTNNGANIDNENINQQIMTQNETHNSDQSKADNNRETLEQNGKIQNKASENSVSIDTAEVQQEQIQNKNQEQVVSGSGKNLVRNKTDSQMLAEIQHDVESIKSQKSDNSKNSELEISNISLVEKKDELPFIRNFHYQKEVEYFITKMQEEKEKKDDEKSLTHPFKTAFGWMGVALLSAVFETTLIIRWKKKKYDKWLNELEEKFKNNYALSAAYKAFEDKKDKEKVKQEIKIKYLFVKVVKNCFSAKEKNYDKLTTALEKNELGRFNEHLSEGNFKEYVKKGAGETYETIKRDNKEWLDEFVSDKAIERLKNNQIVSIEDKFADLRLSQTKQPAI